MTLCDVVYGNYNSCCIVKYHLIKNCNTSGCFWIVVINSATPHMLKLSYFSSCPRVAMKHYWIFQSTLSGLDHCKSIGRYKRSMHQFDETEPGKYVQDTALFVKQVKCGSSTKCFQLDDWYFRFITTITTITTTTTIQKIAYSIDILAMKASCKISMLVIT